MATTIIRTEDGHQQPHGGSLVNLMVADDSEKQFLMAAYGGKIIECSDRNACDVELLCVGAFSPLTGFMDETTYMHCVEHMRYAPERASGTAPSRLHGPSPSAR
mmetsp:Transcript_16257/g.45287  ORF Transcript_16257/g.45287 Transcript_16257/m.45287 type:complete len:104 (-) Transcript_16257:679-990(-)